MTDINVDELIAEARRQVSAWEEKFGPDGRGVTWASLAGRLADALEAARADSLTGQRMHAHWQERGEKAERERDEALAVIERATARVADARLDGTGREDDTWNEALAYAARQLDAAPADALREHDAALIESLADNLVREGVFAPDEGYLDAYEPSHVRWLREKARECREGVS